MSENRERLNSFSKRALDRHALIHPYKGHSTIEEELPEVQETFFLMAIPGMSKSIRKGLNIPLDRCFKGPIW